MPHIVIHNYLTRNLGRFRARASARDCGGGAGCPCDCASCSQKNVCTDSKARDQYARADLDIDVIYEKGTIGNKIRETRHYTVPNFLVDPRGHPPGPAAVAAELRRQPSHATMLRAGWVASKAEGYLNHEQRDVSRRTI